VCFPARQGRSDEEDGAAVNRRQFAPLAVTCFVAALTVVTTYVDVPQFVRIVFGLLMVLVVPGFAAVCAVLPEGQIAFEEQLVAILGISLAMAICAAMLLAAVPIGLSRESFAVALGGITVLLSLYAGIHSLLLSRRRSEKASKVISP
jgi:uncharacterized membrane protein